MNTTEKTRKTKKTSGFTLVELMVVVAIIAVLAVVGLTVFTNSQKGARDAKRRTDIQAIDAAFETHYNPTGTSGFYPSASTAWFAGNSIPVDPLNSGEFSYAGINTGAAGTNSFNICVSLENGGGYCVANQQQ